MNRYADALDLLERAGFRFAIDYDNSLVWAPPAELTATHLGNLVDLVRQCETTLAHQVRRRAERIRALFYGGPLDGRRCTWCHPYSGGCVYHRGVRVNRAKWAVYRLEDDGRAFFVGYAKSETKARRGQVYEAARGPV